MDIYMLMLMGVILLALLMKGSKSQNKAYIIVMAIILFGICALRGVRVGSDLGRYETHYQTCFDASWEGVFERYQWNNIGYYYLCKIHSYLFGYDYHGFLAILAVFEGVCLARLIYKHSVNPYMSFLLYMALGYYTFIYSGLKQALATAFLMLAFSAIHEKNLPKFLLLVGCAALSHLPSTIFLPAYFIANMKYSLKNVLVYLIFAGFITVFRTSLVEGLGDMYDLDVSTESLGGVGGKALMMLIFVVGGQMLRIANGENRTYTCTFNLMVLATILQTFAIYGNIFERLADYYFIFSILYLPFVFERKDLRRGSVKGVFYYDPWLYVTANAGILAFAIFYFYMTTRYAHGLHPYVFH